MVLNLLGPFTESIILIWSFVVVAMTMVLGAYQCGQQLYFHIGCLWLAWLPLMYQYMVAMVISHVSVYSNRCLVTC